jgi:uncharacterized protein YunC (DUF1805 family)
MTPNPSEGERQTKQQRGAVWRRLLAAAAIGAVWLAIAVSKPAGSCGSRACSLPTSPPALDTVGASEEGNEPPVAVETLNMDGQTVTAMKLLQPDGKPYAFVFRAAEGLIVCPHFDLEGLAQGGVAAARAYKWKLHGFREQLDEPIEGLNDLAAAKGITVGMTVRQALGRLRGLDQSAVQSGSSSPIAPRAPPLTPLAGCACRSIEKNKRP